MPNTNIVEQDIASLPGYWIDPQVKAWCDELIELDKRQKELENNLINYRVSIEISLKEMQEKMIEVRLQLDELDK